MSSIPRRVHFIWLGPARLPDYARANIETCRAMHPGFQVDLWTEDQLDFDARFPKTAYVLGQWSRASNYFRMQILERHGGVYLDTDTQVIRPLDPLLDDAAFVGFQLPDFAPDCVNGAVIGSRPGHWFVREARRRLAECMTGAEPVDSSTGPGLVTTLLIERGLASVSASRSYVGDMAIHPRAVFYPYLWTDRPEDRRIAPETVAAHTWAMSWVPVHTPWERRADWARRNLPLYWRVERAAKRARRSRILLRPLSALLATRFEARRRTVRQQTAAR